MATYYEEVSDSKNDSTSRVGLSDSISKQVSNKENSASSTPTSSDGETSNIPFNNGEGKSSVGRIRAIFFGTKRKKQVTVGSGITGFFIGGSIFALLFAGGTGFEFIHMAELLTHAHLSNQQDASNHEVGKLFRYAKSADIGETRLTALGSYFVKRINAQLSSQGITINTEKGNYSSYTIDPDIADDGAQFKGLSQDEIIAKLNENGISGNISSDSNGKTVTVTPDESYYTTKKTAMQDLVSLSGESNIPDALRVRWLGKYNGITWHPLERLGNYANNKAKDLALAAWDKVRGQGIDEGTGPALIDDTTARNNTGTTVVPAEGADTGPTNLSKLQDSLKRLSSGTTGKVIGGVAFAVGLVCTINTVDKNIGNIRYTQDILPMMRLGASVLSTAGQIENGTDVNTDEMNILAKQFTNSKGQSWNEAETIQADQGAANKGEDINQGVKDTVSETAPSWIDWVNAAGIKTAINNICSGIGQAATGVASVVIGLFSEDYANLAIGFLGSILTGPVIQDISNLLSGNAVNASTASGPDFGNEIDYGTRFFANSTAVQDGGTKLSNQQVAILNNGQNIKQQTTFEKQSIAYRLFNLKDYNSLTSRFIDSQSSGTTRNLDNVATSLISITSSLFSSPLKLLSTTVHAQSQVTYNYPFPQYGFSAQDMNSMTNVNPYKNAETVAKWLDTNNSGNTPDYIGLAATCFNVSINKDSSGYWDVVPGASSDPQAMNIYDPTYLSNNCNNPSGVPTQNWLDFRYFIFDTSQMEGYACEQGDSQSCSNDGMSTSSSSTNNSNGSNGSQQNTQAQTSQSNVTHQITGSIH